MRKLIEAITGEELELEESRKKCLEYLENHIENVRNAFNKYFAPLYNQRNISKYYTDGEFYNSLDKVSNLLSEHDSSKYSVEEFDAYRYRFNPTSYELSEPGYSDKANLVMVGALAHHFDNNPHHPEWWGGEDMKLEYIIEMLCDWVSVSLLTDKVKASDWYNSSKSKKVRKIMSKNTRKVVEELLNKLGL